MHRRHRADCSPTSSTPASARRRPPEQVWERCTELGVAVSVLGMPDHPSLVTHDPLPPPVLFSRGDRSVLDGRRVAIVGTRNATAAGRHIARQFGHGLVQAGVHVVSGLARGIDGHAHAGAFEAIDSLGAAGRPVAVVASGLDVVYPREHGHLWQRIGESGLLLSEAPPGSAPIAYRFPLRNRIIAALSEIVVVVESRERGGSLITAAAALERDVPVMAVPGHATSRAAVGVNGLLRDGSAPAIDVDDILVALRLDHGQTLGLLSDRRPRPRSGDVPAYRVCAERARTVGDVAELLDAPVLEVAMMLARLEQSGWLVQVDGWFEAAGSPLR
ncbi:MAG: DNA-protecting protein DprA [Actinobacteria bacterium]|nr:DNA-protecting protein DprA [Actinomycetota bacterium]